MKVKKIEDVAAESAKFYMNCPSNDHKNPGSNRFQTLTLYFIATLDNRS